METSRDTLVALGYQWEHRKIVQWLKGTRWCWSVTSFTIGSSRTYCSFIRVTMEPLGDTVVTLTLSDGCSTDTQMSVECIMYLQNLMVAPTVTLVRPVGDTVVTHGYPSIPTVSQYDHSIAALLPMLPVGPRGDTVETLDCRYYSIALCLHCWLSATTVSHGCPRFFMCLSGISWCLVLLQYLLVATLVPWDQYSISWWPTVTLESLQ